tara:strand:+ start:820 stop:1125 length:306 start_codon:yes stop_codon:yes gene_type:complete
MNKSDQEKYEQFCAWQEQHEQAESQDYTPKYTASKPEPVVITTKPPAIPRIVLGTILGIIIFTALITVGIYLAPIIVITLLIYIGYLFNPVTIENIRSKFK